MPQTRRQRMNGVMRAAIVLPALLLLIPSCATKKWVRETLDQKEASIGQRVDQQFQQHETQRVDGMGQRMGTLETSVGEAATAANGAREVGNNALAKAEGTDKRL